MSLKCKDCKFAERVTWTQQDGESEYITITDDYFCTKYYDVNNGEHECKENENNYENQY